MGGPMLRQRFSSRAPGQALRKSRLHNEKGAIASPIELLRFPIIAGEAVLRWLTGWRPARPLVSYVARRRLQSVIGRSSAVIEFGAGHSTVWLAQRAGSLVSYETDPAWFDRVAKLLARKGLSNVSLVMWRGDEIPHPGAIPDLIIIDGHRRDMCAEFAIAAAGPQTWIFVDNTDKDVMPPDPDREMRRCERLIRDFARETGRVVEVFTGFAPAQLYAEESMLVGPTREPRRP